MPRRALVTGAVRATGWFTLTNTLGPALLYPDRFLVGGLVSASAVGYYAAAHDIATKVAVLPLAVVPVLFSAFAARSASGSQGPRALLGRGCIWIVIVLAPLALALVAVGPELMGLWLGLSFERESGLVIQLLALGLLFQGVAQVPFSMIQALGRPDITGKLMLIELPLFLAALYVAIDTYGIEGAAAVWLARAALDSIALFALAMKTFAIPPSVLRPAGIAFALVLIVACLLLALPAGVSSSIALLAGSIALLGLSAWQWLLSEDDRSTVRGLVPGSG